MRKAFHDFLEHEEARANAIPGLGSRKLVNQLAIVQRPEELRDALVGKGVSIVAAGEAVTRFFGLVHSLYLSAGDVVTRLIIPTVGSCGLYGRSAGDFVTCFLSSGLRICPHLLFTATAGGFLGETGGEVEGASRLVSGVPGDRIAPLETVTYGDGPGEETAILKIPTLLSQSNYREYAKRVITYSHHWCVDAPAFETNRTIAEQIARGASAVDVECYWITRAVTDLPGASFTPIYTLSDDPRLSFQDLFFSLGPQQIYHEKGNEQPELYSLVADICLAAMAS